MGLRHERLQYDTATPLIALVTAYDLDDDDHVDFDQTGWTLRFRMWRNGSSDLTVDDAVATQSAVGRMAYAFQPADVDTSGDYRGVFYAVLTSDTTQRVEWPVIDILIKPVIGGDLELAP